LETDWLRQMMTLMDTHPEYAAVSLRPQVLIGVGPIFKGEGPIIENNVCGGSYRIMRKSAVDDVGGWTPKFENNGRGNEEHDICSRLRAKGYKVGYAKDLWTYHLFGKEGTWGYDKNSDYKMGRYMDHSPSDSDHNPITCEPRIHSNE